MIETRRNWPESLTGLGIAIAGLIVGLEAASIKVIPLYAKVGPAAFLWCASALLLLCGVWVAWQAKGEPSEAADWRGPAAIMFGLLQTVFLLEPLGFVISSAVLFVMTAWGLGSRRWLRDGAIGLAISALAFVVFRYGLGLRLPVGALFS